MGGFIPTCQAQTFVELAKLENVMSFFEKKIRSAAEVRWGQAHDDAIEFLKCVEPGSYFDECAELMEELLAQIEAAKPKRQRLTAEERDRQRKAGAGAVYYFRCKGIIK